jgi:hypothetical protein
LGSRDGIRLNDLKMRNGTVYHPSLEAAIRVADDWMVNTPFQPLICDMFPRSSYASSQTCEQDRALVEEACDLFVTRQMLKVRASDLKACFSQPEVNGMSGTRLYDDCITEMCHSCSQDSDLTECVPQEAMRRFKQACTTGGVVRKIVAVDFAQAVRDAQASLESNQEAPEGQLL